MIEAEKRDLLNAYDAIEESAFLLREKSFDQSFAKVRSAYILTTRTESTLKGLIQTSSQSLLPMLFLFVFIASASAYLISEKTFYLEISISDENFYISINSLMEIVLYVLLATFFFFSFPGSRLIPQSNYIIMAIFAFFIGKISRVIFSRLAYSEKSEERSIQFKSAVIAAFMMGSRNLRRRKKRTTLNLLSIIILVFGFILLTSISSGYGLTIRTYGPVLPINALLIKDEPLGGFQGSFLSLPESFIEWLESYPNVTLVSPKAENNIFYSGESLGSLYSESGERMNVLGIIGIIPSKEANLTGFNRIVIKGDYLKDDELEGILLSSSLQDSLNIDVGDKVYGFGQEFIVKGFFDENILSRLMDINGQTLLPYYLPAGSPVPVPCPSSSVIILTYEKALTLPDTSISRVAVQLSDVESYKPLARIIAFTHEYKVYLSSPTSLTRYSLEGYVEEHGTEIVPFLICLVILNLGTSMFASVHERKNEIASLSSVGLNPTHIAALFVAESLIIGIIGGGLGYLLGISGYRLASLLGGLQVREKASAEWGLISLFLSGLTAVTASLIPALRSSTLITPSLRRKWKIEGNAYPMGPDKKWVLDLPVKLMIRELEPFTAFMIKRLREEGRTTVNEINIEEEPSEKGEVRKISFKYSPLERALWTKNELTIQPEGKRYVLKLICALHGSSPNPEYMVHTAATFVRKLLLEWSTASCTIVTLFDPYLSRLYSLVNAYSPTTLYVISTYSDTQGKIEDFRNALVLRGLRPPMLAVSKVDPMDLEQVMKVIKDLISIADRVCITGENTTLCTALAIEVTRQNKVIGYAR